MIQQLTVIPWGSFLDPFSIECDPGSASGSQYASDLGNLIHYLCLIAEVHGINREGSVPSTPVDTIPVRCQLFITCGGAAGIHTPNVGIESFEPVVTTADVHAGVICSIHSVYEVERQSGGPPGQVVLADCSVS